MKAEDQYMDDFFRKAAAEQQAAYNPDFWKEMEAQLNDDSLDTAFKSAAGIAAQMPDFNIGEALDDAFLDDAFKTAAQQTTVEYPAGAWSTFLKERAVLEQDAAFIAASNAVTADYHPVFWSDADQALRNEGLHYEYKSAYWNDAKNMLDHADRGVFFRRWSAVAAVLLLVSLIGFYQPASNGRITTPMTAGHTHAVSTGSQNMLADESTPAVSNEIQNSTTTPAENEFVVPSEQNTNITNRVDAAVQNPMNESVQTNEMVERIVTDQPVVTDQLVNSGIIIPNSTQPENSDNTASSAESINSGDSQLTHESSQTTDNAVTQGSSQISNVSSDATTLETIVDEQVTDEALVFLPGTPVNGLILNTAYPGPPVEVERFRLPSSHAISLVGSAGIGNKYGEVDFTPTYRTSVGFEYNHSGFGRLRNYEFGGNLVMNHVRQNGFGTERRVSVFNVHGGVDKFWYKLQYKDMIYATAGAYMGYRLNQRHSIRAAVAFDYLVFVQSNMSYKVNADEGITTVNNNWGIKEGLNNMDLRLGLGYEFDITKRFAVQLNGSFGLFDRSDDSFISTNFLDHELNATVGLKYTFLRKI